MSIRKFTVDLKGASPLSFSRHHTTPKLTQKETPEQWEQRTWREKLHYNPDTLECFIGPMFFKNGLSEAAKFANIKIPGQRNATYTKHFERGVIVSDPAPLLSNSAVVTKDTVQSETFYVPADGVRGGGKRVDRTFPVVTPWSTTVIFQVWDDVIGEEIFLRILKEFGLFIGIGRFRPQNNGYYGRFTIVDYSVEQQII